MNRQATLVLAALILGAVGAPAHAAPAALAARQESAATLVQKGRELLAAGKVADAQAAFDAAYALDKSPKMRTWVVRGWIAQARFDEALQAAEEQAKEAAADADYLFGLTFLGLARQSMAAGGNQYTQSQLIDACGALKRATAADGQRYRDAWLPLAEAAWYTQALDDARAAARKGLELEPGNVEGHVLLGRIEFSAYVAAADEAAKEPLWKASFDAFQKAAALYGEPLDAARRSALADVVVQLGNLQVWKQDLAAAGASYAKAMGLDPARVPFDQLHASLGAEGFLACVADGCARFKAAAAEHDARFATLSWWHGYALFENAKWAESEAAFRKAVELYPQYANSWYYVFRALHSQQKYPEAIEALRTYFRATPEGLASALAGDELLSVAAIDFLVGWCVDPAKQRVARNEDAAFLCEVLTRVQPTVARHWNNLGLFLRDAGDALKAAKRREADPAVLQDLWQRSLAAYQKSLELEPGNPNFLNDTAVMFHYYLKSDFDKAMAMYELAAKRADEELARKDLAQEVRDVVAIARRDSNDNIRRLKKYLERRAAGEDVDPNAVR